ncbi:unnamed protein product [Absidia cylindrospora]
MPAINTTLPKTLKWALPKTLSSGSRIQKKISSTRASCRSNPATPSSSIKRQKPKSEMDRLASELAFTYDTLATIVVHFESLHLAYTSSQAELKETFCPTRLGPKEKELLAAYDDLGLQVTHLERKIKTLESRLQELRSQEEHEEHDITASSASVPSSTSPTSSIYSFDISPSTCCDPTFFVDDIASPPLINFGTPQCCSSSYFNGSYDHFMVPPMSEDQSSLAALTDTYTYYPSAAPSLFAQ